jgi:hypothetical protein
MYLEVYYSRGGIERQQAVGLSLPHRGSPFRI